MNEDNDCPRCHVSVTTDEGCEPTEFCHHCAQDLLIELQADKARLDWLKAEPYERLQKVREWLPISYVPPAPDNLRAAIDNAMKHDPNYRP